MSLSPELRERITELVQSNSIQVRKFLKQVGVTSQREIESAVRRAVESGRLKGGEKLKTTARVQIEGIGLDHLVEGEIALS